MKKENVFLLILIFLASLTIGCKSDSSTQNTAQIKKHAAKIKDVQANIKEITAKSSIDKYSRAIFSFKNANYFLPPPNKGLSVLLSEPPGSESRINNIEMDPWGNPYIYKNPGVFNKTDYDLYSLGPNGKYDGLSGDDIHNYGDSTEPWFKFKDQNGHFQKPKDGTIKRSHYNDALNSIFQFYKGELVGTGQVRFKSGAMKAQYEFKDGFKNGIIKYYGGKDQVIREETYNRGKLGKISRFYPSGELKSKQSFVNGFPNSKRIDYFTDGTVNLLGEGISKGEIRHKDGSVTEITYKNGKEISRKKVK
ncbi:hypothetical protein BVX98_00375 [bacterium F11]|nr:hypothetical protein BVX98_00375 [bacterium F11]